MSKEAMKWYGAQRIADAGLKNILFVLAYDAKKGTGECTTSQSELAAGSGLTSRAVRANLVVLERLEMIKRRPRNRGRYGRTTDLITLALDRNFDVPRSVVRAVRLSLRPSKADFSQRKIFPLPAENTSGEYNQEYQGSLSGGEDLAPTVDVGDTHEGTSQTPARPACKVLPFKRGGAA